MKKSESLTRSISGSIYIALLVGSTYFSETSFYIIFGIFLFIVSNEYCKVVKLTKYSKAVPLFNVLIFNLFCFANIPTIIINSTLIVSISFILYGIYFLFKIKKERLNLFQKNFFNLGYIIFPFIFLVKIPFLSNQFTPFAIIGVFILIWVNDTFAYIVGKNFGKNKLFESVSPKKTIEGFLGGLFFTIIFAFILSISFKFFTFENWFIIGLLVSIFGTLGDLFESKLKRIAKIKDSGNIMPGHGGLLDRLDSVIFVAPIVYLYLKLYYVS
ncbi:MAG: phosphatidate cytidylyltransferase [Flavobacterium sp.]|jgi:phosphatidate cytidylyltransferase